jgi:hypothetical protein
MRSCARYRPFTSGPETAAQTPAHNFRRDTAADYSPAMMMGNLQTEQTIVGPTARKASTACVAFSGRAARSRHDSVVAGSLGEDSLTEATADTRGYRSELLKMPHAVANTRWDRFSWAESGYSMTSSARARIVGGMLRPSSFAVLRLTTSSKVVGCITGRSAGLAPSRMRPA